MDVSKNNLEQAIASLRLSRGSSPACCNLEADVDALMAALDAARGEAVGSVQAITSLVGETRKCIVGALEVIDSLPVNTAVYAAPPAAACDCDWPLLGNCESCAPPAPPRVERYGDGVLVHWPDGVEQYVQVGDCVTGNLAAPPAARAVPADVARHAAAAVSYLDHAGGMPAGLSLALQRLRDALAQQPAAAVPEVNYLDAQRIADEYSLPYNAFCAAHRAMLAAAERKGGVNP